jgi:acetyl-CoA carboxylase biotin carboxyl carrier protein
VTGSGPHDGERVAAGRTDAGVLDELCRSVVRLVQAARTPPVLLRVRFGTAGVELRWPTAGAPAQRPPGVPPEPQADPEAGRFYICAPMVGTFYHAPEPGAQPYVRVGDLVGAGQPVGVLEAMKLFNPVHVEQPGRVVEVLVADGSPVEYGQRLIGCTAEGDG